MWECISDCVGQQRQTIFLCAFRSGLVHGWDKGWMYSTQRRLQGCTKLSYCNILQHVASNFREMEKFA